MNFEEWSSNFKEYPDRDSYDEEFAKHAWEACKEEVLKIIHKEPNSVSILFTNIIKKIEKL